MCREQAIAQNICDIIKNKTICDLGCGDGKQVLEFTCYAKKTIGIDHATLPFKNFGNIELIKDDIYTMKIPKADVYYAWISYSDHLKILKLGLEGIIIFGANPHNNESNHGLGREIDVKYDDKYFKLTVINDTTL